MTLQALPEIRAVQVGVAELQSRQPHGTGTASGRRGHVRAGGQGGDSRRPRPAPGTRDRRELAGTQGDAQGKRVPRAAPPARGSAARGRLRAQASSPEARRAHTREAGRGAGPLRSLSPGRIVAGSAEAAEAQGRGRSRKVLSRRADTSGSSALLLP